ncbi:MAG TPA: segregation/condensation protein A [Candidatus Paceibacterota bacterium]|jgi:segregation and condensation protein A|nr:segregation/condensation protein A [Candidatus Paceibacterota bacterium]HRS48054.1 segregation/condensation protein A [Candidatus Paceibacterota bacterium]
MEIKLANFSGPLPLLLDLIEKNRLPITEVSLSLITEEYLNIIRDSDEINPLELADFLVIASTLLLLKSKTILPDLQLTTEEEEDIKKLEIALMIYQKYKEKIKFIKELSLSSNKLISRILWQDRNAYFYPPSNISLDQLKDVLKKTLLNLSSYYNNFQKNEITKGETIETKINEILLRIKKLDTLEFEKLITKNNKNEIIVCFLAILFLFRENKIYVEQKEKSNKIYISKNE